MTKINFSYFIRLLITIIKKEKINFINSGILLYVFSFVVYHGFCIYNYRFKPIDEYFEKYRYSWYKAFFLNTKFYDNFIIFLSIYTIQLINNDLHIDYIDEQIISILNIVNSDNDYIEFNEQYFKIVEDTKKIIENYFNKFELKNIFGIEKNEFENKISESIDIENNGNILFKCYIKKDKIKNTNEFIMGSYNKINKANELIEILNICQNISLEQKIITKFWINAIEEIGIIGFWNLILYSCYKYDFNNQFIQVEIFFKLNFHLYQAILYLNYVKKFSNSISPYHILKENILEFNNKSLWFVEEGLKPSYLSKNDYPSEIHLLSSLAANIITLNLGSNTNISKFSVEEINIFSENYKFIGGENFNLGYFPIILDNESTYNNPVILSFKEWDSISASIEISHMYTIQSFITSNHIGKEIAIIISDYNNYF